MSKLLQELSSAGSRYEITYGAWLAAFASSIKLGGMLLTTSGYVVGALGMLLTGG